LKTDHTMFKADPFNKSCS